MKVLHTQIKDKKSSYLQQSNYGYSVMCNSNNCNCSCSNVKESCCNCSCSNIKESCCDCSCSNIKESCCNQSCHEKNCCSCNQEYHCCPETIQVDWHDINNPTNKEAVLKYVFKEQIYYVRDLCQSKLDWIPLLQNNGNVFLNEFTSTQYSSSIDSNLAEIIPMTNAPVVYPDYSGVDVGKGIKWPQKAFSPYVDATAWPPFKFADLSETTTKVPYYNLGFIVSRTPMICEPSWGGYYDAGQGPLNDQIKKLRQNGGDVTISFGGAANVPIHITAPDVDSLFEQYRRFSDAYGLTRIDFDIEGPFVSVSYEVQNTRNAQALKKLQDYYKNKGEAIEVWFTLPILPTGLTPDGIKILSLALENGVEIGGVNAMTMDYGDAVAPDPEGRMGQYGIEAITSLKNQLNTLYQGSKTEAELWAMIGTTPMIGRNDVVSEIFRQSDATQTLQFAQTNSIGMISMWSANRDNSSSSGIEQSDNQFSIIFNAYNI